MSTIGTTGSHAARGGYSLLGTMEWLEGMLERRRTRIALMEMSEAQLKDIGVSRAEVGCDFLEAT